MKRELGAFTLLLLLMLIAGLSIRVTDRMIDTVELSLRRSERALERGDFEAALLALDDARQTWHSCRGHCHIFLRHADVDAVGDAFCSLEGSLRQQDPGAAAADLAMLRYHLEMIDFMEHLSPGSILTSLSGACSAPP